MKLSAANSLSGGESPVAPLDFKPSDDKLVRTEDASLDIPVIDKKLNFAPNVLQPLALDLPKDRPPPQRTPRTSWKVGPSDAQKCRVLEGNESRCEEEWFDLQGTNPETGEVVKSKVHIFRRADALQDKVAIVFTVNPKLHKLMRTYARMLAETTGVAGVYIEDYENIWEVDTQKGQETVERIVRFLKNTVYTAQSTLAYLDTRKDFDTSSMGAVGASLGGFGASLVAKKEARFDKVLLLMAGGNLAELFEKSSLSEPRELWESLKRELKTDDAGVRRYFEEKLRDVEVLSGLESMRGKKLRVINSSGDPVIPTETAKKFIAAMEKAGVIAETTIIDFDGHDPRKAITQPIKSLNFAAGMYEQGANFIHKTLVSEKKRVGHILDRQAVYYSDYSVDHWASIPENIVDTFSLRGPVLGAAVRAEAARDIASMFDTPLLKQCMGLLAFFLGDILWGIFLAGVVKNLAIDIPYHLVLGLVNMVTPKPSDDTQVPSENKTPIEAV